MSTIQARLNKLERSFQNLPAPVDLTAIVRSMNASMQGKELDDCPWPSMVLHPKQSRFWRSRSRFNVVPCGRRSGKTEIARRRAIVKALKFQGDGFVVFAAPVHQQAKRIHWQKVKQLTPIEARASEPSESELSIKLKNGPTLLVTGMDKPQRIEGNPVIHLLGDEWADMKDNVWPAHIRPMFSETRGSADLIGAPSGRGKYYRRFRRAHREQVKAKRQGRQPTWAAHHWTTAEILPYYLGQEAAEEEISEAKKELDELTFRQEYEGEFVTFEGLAYYAFDERLHAGFRLSYDPDDDLILMFDFNVEPGTAGIAQEQRLPNGNDGTGIIGEVYIERNSNTPAVCRRIANTWGNHRGQVFCYGDATGGARSTSQTTGTDWDLIEKHLRPVFGRRLNFRVPKANPRERVRVNSVNSRFSAGRMFIDPYRAPRMIEDFAGVRLKESGTGEIDKSHDKTLTHLSDEVGYYVAHRFPLSGNKTKIESI